MNARTILAAAAALCLTMSVSAFAQSGLTTASAPQPAAQPSLTPSPAPRSWSEAPQPPAAANAPQPPTAATASRAVRVTPVISTDPDQQTPPPALAPTMPGRLRGQLLNVKVEFTISDQMGAKPPIRKTMSMVVADRESSRIRTSADYYVKLTRETKPGAVESYLDRRSAPLSVDVNPAVEGNKIRLDFSIEYTVDGDSGEGVPPSKTNVSERLAAVLDSGVPMVVAQSSDAVSDRKVTIEIKATIMK
jgi:hypothetical protein